MAATSLTHSKDRIYGSERDPIKRRCVGLLRVLLQELPSDIEPGTFLKLDRRAQDAVYTLVAMKYSPGLIATFVAKPFFRELDVVQILTTAAARKLHTLLKAI